MYRLFPWVSVGFGMFFFVFVQSVGGMGLCTLLVGYGLFIKLRRAVG